MQHEQNFVSLKPEWPTGTDNQNNRTTQMQRVCKDIEVSFRQQRLDAEMP